MPLGVQRLFRCLMYTEAHLSSVVLVAHVPRQPRSTHTLSIRNLPPQQLCPGGEIMACPRQLYGINYHYLPESILARRWPSFRARQLSTQQKLLLSLSPSAMERMIGSKVRGQRWIKGWSWRCYDYSWCALFRNTGHKHERISGSQ